MRRHTRQKPDAIALRFEGRSATYAELDWASDRAAHALLRAGLQPGARICYLGKNSDAYIELTFAAMRARCCLTPINWRLTVDEARYIVEDAGAEMLFADASMIETAVELAGSTSCVNTLIAIGAARGGLTDYGAWRDCAGEMQLLVPDAADSFLQIYTSGTTGRPKGVMMTHGRYAAHLRRLRGIDEPWLVYQTDDVVLVAMPFFHLSGSCPMLDAFDAGARVVLLREFNAGKVVDAIVEEGITRTFAVPAALRTMIDDPRLADKNRLKLRYIAYGASPIDPRLLTRLIATLGCEFVHFYGMTESLTSITGLRPEDHRADRGGRWKSVGRPLPAMNIRIAGADGHVLPPGQIGEIQLKSAYLTAGYWKQPEETARMFSAGGWLKTGDAGRIDDDGYLYIEDRIRDMIISGGENVYPLEIEKVLNEHPGIGETAVVGAPDEKWGERVLAFVVPESGACPDPAEILRWVQGRLSPYKCPKEIRFVQALPRNAAGKILRRELRQSFTAPEVVLEGAAK